MLRSVCPSVYLSVPCPWLNNGGALLLLQHTNRKLHAVSRTHWSAQQYTATKSSGRNGIEGVANTASKAFARLLHRSTCPHAYRLGHIVLLRDILAIRTLQEAILTSRKKVLMLM